MGHSKPVIRDLYYTHDHEWIDFQGTVAYIGICIFRLLGVQQIKKIVFSRKMGFMNQGEVIAIIHGRQSRLPFHMPVEGKIISLNECGPLVDQHLLQTQPENDEWLALIGLAKPYDRTGLLQSEQYRVFIKRRS